MSPRHTLNAVRAIFLLCAALLGWSLASVEPADAIAPMPGLFLGLGLGVVVIGADVLLRNLTLRSFSTGTMGLMIGILCAWLINTIPWSEHGEATGSRLSVVTIKLAIYLSLGFIGTSLALRSNRQEFSLLIPYVRFRNEGSIQQPLLVDTNIIIDGRIPGICATGFLGGSLIIPRFVLDELHFLADSSEPIKRDRGRRGLACLEELQKTSGLEVTIHDDYMPGEKLVDTKLIQLAKGLDARLLTNDTNLGRVAHLQGIAVLNLNQLAQSMRQIINTGDEIDIALVKEGKDDQQAVGYLPDGAMIVVNNARDRIGSAATVVVSSSLQTSAGRLIFAELKKPGHEVAAAALHAPPARGARK